MRFAIQLVNQPIKRIFNEIAGFTLFKHYFEGGKFCFFFFQQPQSRSYHFAGRGIAATLDLIGHKGFKMLMLEITR